MVGKSVNSNMDECERAFVRLADSVLGRIGGWIAQEGLQEDERMWVVFDTDRQCHTTLDRRAVYQPLLDRHSDELLSETTELRHLAETLVTRGIMPTQQQRESQGLTPEEARRREVGEMLRPIVALLSDHRMLEPDPEAIVASYRRFVEGRSAEEQPIHARFLLAGLASDAAMPVDLGGGFVIDTFSPEEKTELWNMGSGLFGTPMPMVEFMDVKYILRQRYSFQRKASTAPHLESLDGLRRVITALRVTKPGLAGTTTTYYDSTEWCPFYGVVTSHFGPSHSFEIRSVPAGREYALSESHVPEVRKWHQRLVRLDDTNEESLMLALRRFNQSYGRDHGEDRVIDWTIALESTLLQGLKDELRYRFALRGAAVLAAVQDPCYTFRLLRTAYDIRSKLVHEGLTMRDKKIAKLLRGISAECDLSQFFSTYEDMVRAVLRHYVCRCAEGDSVSSVNAAIDQGILSALSGECRFCSPVGLDTPRLPTLRG